MTPAQVHINVAFTLIAGIFPIMTVGEPPGIQGATVTGTQGTGVGTPNFAAVAAIKAGLVGALHMPNGGILATGILSMMVAAGIFPALTMLFGMTIKVEGATPNEHCIIAPFTTSGDPISKFLSLANSDYMVTKCAVRYNLSGCFLGMATK